MAAYIVFCVKSVHDQEGMNEYRRQVGPLTEVSGLKKAAGPMVHTVLEGNPLDAFVALEFADVEAATDWYHSEEYQRVAKIRKASSESDVYIVESWPTETAK